MEKRHVYDKLPEFVKDAMGWGIRRLPRFQWRETPEEKLYFEQLAESEYASAEQLREIQSTKLRRLIKHAATHVPHYRDFFATSGIKAEDIRTVEDLRQLPLLTKSMIRADPESFVSETAGDRSRLTTITTGGSTGTPMRYYFDEHMLGVRRATWKRWSSFAGVDLYRDRMVYCGGAPTRWIYPPDKYRGIVNYERNKLTLSSAAMSDRVLDQYIDDIKRFKGDYIRGYASGIYMLARRVTQKGVVLPFKAVLTSSDTLFPQYRHVIEEAFGCSVFDHYGQNEDILTATECGVEPGLHINVESCIAETVDAVGVPVTDAEGRFASTHLENYTTPLIRYVVGDVGVLDSAWKPCGCGRSHQKIVTFTGRDDEIIQTPEGRRIGAGSMNQPMKTMNSSIQQCQFIQERLDLLRVKVVPASSWDDSRHRDEFERNIRIQVGDKIGIEIEIVGHIPSRDNGKYQFIVSNISSNEQRMDTP